jgi:hypothetical protein
MKNWWAENSKWLYPAITFFGGLLLGFYLCILRYESSLEIIKDKIMDVKEDIHELKWIIQNRLLTKPIE